MSVRAEQKLRTRRALMDAALAQLSADRGFGSLSLREVAREAGIAPTSFYRHFAELDELGLALVDEGGVALRQLMRQARKRIARDGSAISTSIETFMEYLGNNANLFRLMLRERTGVSKPFRTAVQAEIDHFVTELADDLRRFAEEEGKPLGCPPGGGSDGHSGIQPGRRSPGRHCQRAGSAQGQAENRATDDSDWFPGTGPTSWKNQLKVKPVASCPADSPE